MKMRQAIRILMLSPVYFLLTPPQRLELIKEFCQKFDKIQK